LKKIIITGATGFIGSNLVKYLIEHNYDIAIIVRESSTLKILDTELSKITVFRYNGNLECLIDFFKDFQADAVVHLAAYFVAEHMPTQIDSLVDSNIRFSMHIAEAMHQSGVKNMINTSTSWQHYQDQEYNPASLYAATKQAVEDIFKYYSDAWSFNIINLVIYDSFGIDDSRNKIISLFRKIANTGDVLYMSEGDQKVDLVYITDIIEAYMISLERILDNKCKGFHKYYLKSGNEKSLKEIAEIFSKVFDVSLPIAWGKRPYRMREVMSSYPLGEQLPGWDTQITLEEGLTLIKNN